MIDRFGTQSTPKAKKRTRSGRLSPRTVGFLALCCITLIAGIPAVAASPVVIKLWDHHVHDKKFRKDIFKKFNADNPDIKVEYTSQVSGTYQTILAASYNAGDMPDIFIAMGEASLPKLVDMGWVMPLDDLAPSKEAFQKWQALFPQDQLPFVNEINMFNGKVYSWPIATLTGWMMIFYNTKLFMDAGLKGTDGQARTPETWDDMRQFARKITELGQGKVYGIVHGIKSGNWEPDIGQSLAVVAGWPFRGLDFRTGHYDFHSWSLRGPIQLWLDMKNDGSIFPGDLSMDDEQAKYKFAQNLAGMNINGYWGPGGFLAVNPDLEFDCALPPTEQRGVYKGYLDAGPVAGMSEYVVSSKVKSKEAIWKVITFMTSAQYQEEWVKAGGGASVFPQYNKTEYFPHPTVAKIAMMGRLRPAAPPMPTGYKKVEELREYIRPDYNEIIQGMWVGMAKWADLDNLEKLQDAALGKAFEEAKKFGVNLTRADITFPDWDRTKSYVPKAKK